MAMGRIRLVTRTPGKRSMVQRDVDALGEQLARARQLVATQHHDAAAAVLDDLLDAVVAADAPDADRDLAVIRVRALCSRATVDLETSGRFEAGWARLDEADHVVTAGGLHELRVPLQGARAYLLLRAGRTEEAMAAFRQADEWWDQADGRDHSQLLLNRGSLALEIGSLAAAEEDFCRCEAEALEVGRVVIAQKARHNRGHLAFLRGDLPTALRLMGSPVSVDDPTGAVADLLRDPIVAIDRARALVEAGLWAEADDLLAGAVADLARAERSQDEGEARLAWSRVALLSSDLDLASEQADLAARCFERVGNPRWRRRATMTSLAVRLEDLQRRADQGDTGGDPSRPAGVLDAAVAEWAVVPGPGFLAATQQVLDALATLLPESAAVDEVHLQTPLRLMMAETMLLRGDLDGAAEQVEQVSDQAFDAFSVRLRWHRAAAELAARRRSPSVHERVATGLDELAVQQGRLGSLDLRTAMAIHGRELATIGVRAALGAGDPDLVHAAVERGKASSTRLPAVRSQVGDEDRDLLGQLRRANKALDDLDAGHNPAMATSIRATIDDLMADLRERSWGRGSAPAATGIVSVDQALDGLRSVGAAGVTYERLGDRLLAIVLDSGELEVVDLGDVADAVATAQRIRSDLEALLTPGLPAGIRTVVTRSLTTSLGELDDRLLVPTGVADRPAVIIAEAGLAAVPWSLLPSRRGARTTTAPCLTAWCRASTAAGDSAVAAAADGASDAGPARSVNAAAGLEDASRASDRGSVVRVAAFAGPGLARSGLEAQAVAAQWSGGVAHVGDAATSEAVKESLARDRVVHLATHGVHRDTAPMFSSVRLADGHLYAHELPAFVASDLVLLSACEVGAATVRPGDEPLGLTAALLHAGVATVVAGVTRVRDEVAHDVMVAVHRSLGLGADPATAIGVAVAEAWEQGEVAPFVCAGAGMVA